MDRTTCLERLRAAIDWGTSRERPAWARTIARIEQSDGRYRLEDLELQRSVVATASEGLDAWFGPIHDRADDPAQLAQLELSPADVWRSMVCMRGPLFAYQPGEDPLAPLLTTVASTVPGDGPLYLSLDVDGWGVKA